MTGALSKIRDANPQVLFIGAEEIQSGLAVKQARSLGIKAVIAEGAPASTPLYVSTAGAANVEGTIVSSPYLSNDVTAADAGVRRGVQEGVRRGSRSCTAPRPTTGS